MRRSFFQFEAVSVGSEINICEEAQHDLSLLCLDALENSNSSIIAIDNSTNEVVGAAINVIQVFMTRVPSYIDLVITNFYFLVKFWKF